jgi:uncharacterized repeat protein (TIGR01451 family)
MGFAPNSTGIWHWAATYNGDLNNNPVSSGALDEPVTVSSQADLAVTKTVDNSIPIFGTPITYTIAVTNHGPDTATDVLVADPLPPGLVLIAAVPSQGSVSGAVVWSVGTLANGATAVLQVMAQTAADGLIVNNAVARADQFDPDRANNLATASVIVQLSPDQISKLAFLGSTILGDPSTAGVINVEISNLPGMLGGPIFATGADAGGRPQVNVYDARTGVLKFSFFAFDPGFTGGVRVAIGDINGDGIPDIVTAAGPGDRPLVEVFDGATGAMIRSFLAFDPSFTGGVTVAVGDVNGDGFGDIIVGADAGGVPAVKVCSGKDGSLLAAFLAYTPDFPGGVRVAAGNIDPDGRADIITGTGPGGLPMVAVYDIDNGRASLLRGFLAFNPFFTGGVYVGTGDVNGDSRADIITGAGAGGLPAVEVFSGLDASLLAGFFAYDPRFTGGVRVAAADLNGDGRADILTGPGPGGGPNVLGFSGVNLDVLDNFFAYDPLFHDGIFVAGA